MQKNQWEMQQNNNGGVTDFRYSGLAHQKPKNLVANEWKDNRLKVYKVIAHCYHFKLFKYSYVASPSAAMLCWWKLLYRENYKEPRGDIRWASVEHTAGFNRSSLTSRRFQTTLGLIFTGTR